MSHMCIALPFVLQRIAMFLLLNRSAERRAIIDDSALYAILFVLLLKNQYLCARTSAQTAMANFNIIKKNTHLTL